MKVLKLTAAAFAMAGLLSADTIYLKSGQAIGGAYVGGDNHSIRFLIGDTVNTYQLSDIASINFGSPDAAPSQPPPPADQQQPPQQAPPPEPQQAPPPDQSQAAPPPAPAAPQPPPQQISQLLIPAGAPVIVRLIDPVNSDTDRLGQTYRASVDEPIVINGYEVAPRGSDCVVALVASQQAGRIEGRTAMTLALRTLTIQGRAYPVTSTGVVKAAASRSKRSGEVIGGTAALGAIIGAIAGGGSGAAIGAVAGGAVGAAAQMGMNTDHVHVPAETRLTFTLQNPVYLQQ